MYPSGRRTPSISPLLGSIVPALLPRMSRVELRMIGRLRGVAGPSVLPAGAPPDELLSQVRLRSGLVRYYLDQFPEPDRFERSGVDTLCDVATVLHLDRWIPADLVEDTMGPLRALVGPEEQLGFGPEYAEVLDVLHGIAELTGSAQQVRAIGDAWSARPEDYWADLAGELQAAASFTAREFSLRMVTRVTAVSSATVRRSPVFRATRLRAAAVILADVVDTDLVAEASLPWEAGISRDRRDPA